MENQPIYVHEIKLPGESEFAGKFNHVSTLFQKWQETQSDEDWKNFIEAKQRLELGY